MKEGGRKEGGTEEGLGGEGSDDLLWTRSDERRRRRIRSHGDVSINLSLDTRMASKLGEHWRTVRSGRPKKSEWTIGTDDSPELFSLYSNLQSPIFEV